jgi:hypothetical protein
VWIEAIDRGAWRYDRGQEQWVVDADMLTAWPAAKRGLV